MSLLELSPLENHLWQSTLCVGVAWLLTLAFRKNRAAVRYWIWLGVRPKIDFLKTNPSREAPI